MAPVQETLKREARTRKRGNLTEKFGDRKIGYFPKLGCGLCILTVCFGPYSSFGASAANSKVQESNVVFKTTALQCGVAKRAEALNLFNGLLEVSETVETVSLGARDAGTPLKRGVNERRYDIEWAKTCDSQIVAFNE